MSVEFTAKTKGYMKNNNTGEIKKFQYNPEQFQYSRGVKYAEIIAPGMAYPLTQFVSGQIRTFSIELFFYNNPSTGLIHEYMLFIGAFLTPETNLKSYKKPPMMTFVYGKFIRQCVLDNLDVNIEEYDTEGDYTQARFTLTLRQVSP